MTFTVTKEQLFTKSKHMQITLHYYRGESALIIGPDISVAILEGVFKAINSHLAVYISDQ
jgi:hypothetical protein